MKYKITDYESRYFIGIEYAGGIKSGNSPKLGQLWDDFLKEDIKLIIDVPNYDKFIGLECYPPDFKELKVYDYFALLETKDLVKRDGFISKKLPKGKFIEFEIKFDDIHNETKKVYQYLKDNKINIHFGFNYEDYLKDQDYTKSNAILNFVFKLEE